MTNASTPKIDFEAVSFLHDFLSSTLTLEQVLKVLL